MEIKKADSKGRVTGFAKNLHYSMWRSGNGTVILKPLEEDTDIDIPTPVNQPTRTYLEKLGLDINRISVDGVSRSGYDRIVPPGVKQREVWPEGFDFDEFTALAWGG